MSGDQRVGILEPGAPSAYIDNEEVTNDLGQSVLRQKLRAPMVESLLSRLVNLLGPLGLAAGAGRERSTTGGKRRPR